MGAPSTAIWLGVFCPVVFCLGVSGLTASIAKASGDDLLSASNPVPRTARATDNRWHGAIKFRGVRAPPISSTWRIWETCAIDPQWIDSARLCEVRFDG
jgi:hypothetical protein